MFKRKSSWSLIFFLIIVIIPAYALPTDKDQPVHITADSAHLDKSTGVSVFQGHVKLTQGTGILVTDKLTLYSDKNNQLLKAVATGGQTTYQTITDPAKPPFVATAQMIQYLPPESKIILTGDAKAVQGPNTYAAPQIEYHIDSETVISPSSAGGRTTIEITPQTFQHK
jgi:lipopolysaccharide export system protein LptA